MRDIEENETLSFVHKPLMILTPYRIVLLEMGVSGLLSMLPQIRGTLPLLAGCIGKQYFLSLIAWPFLGTHQLVPSEKHGIFFFH